MNRKTFLLVALSLLSASLFAQKQYTLQSPDGKITVIDLLVKAGLCTTKSDARRTITQGGVFVADENVADVSSAVEESRFDGDGLIIRKGKKNFHKFTK